MCSQLMIVFVTIGCTPGSRVPSPHDDCNTCICGEDGSIGACTRILCSDGKLMKIIPSGASNAKWLSQPKLDLIYSLFFANFR